LVLEGEIGCRVGSSQGGICVLNFGNNNQDDSYDLGEGVLNTTKEEREFGELLLIILR